ncbi:MAG TPA: hypothetical protein H9717_09465 [Candidatus Eisenbergiella merdipullorum]|uniref:Uncharacterized protein n=1 Tax=Candidatus Eisenbergiella merdipullorum TaxID=2838553 RepID=A0A9D2I4W2_9FIRM|nr:hypothetical protein [Candidatus Eisenbergiella merdipullorum]
MNETVHANRKHKDSVFRMLYSRKEELLPLYNALNGTDYQDPGQLEVTTLENAIYMNMKNDVSFLLDAEMMLYEHQSTWNPNMPLRDLFYISRLLEKYVSGESLYASTLIKLPAPHFVVFYNGSQDAPEDLTLRLSDAFEGRKGYPQERKEPELELKVRFLNINRGHNEGLMKRCRTLREYSEFVSRIRQYADGETAIEEAVDRAVTECIAEGILADFLRSQRAEVIAMSIFEYNEEEELKKYGQAEYRSGEINGKAEGKAESVILALEMKGTVPEQLKDRIFSEKDISLLEDWLKAAIGADTIETFMDRTGLKEK